jgi:hypothetical protein
LKICNFRYPQRKKLNVGRLGDLTGYVVFPYLEITWSGNRLFTTAMKAQAVWHIAPSCWNNISSLTGEGASAGAKFSNMCM